MLDDCKVLVVEDEAMIALDLSMTLEDEGADVAGPFATVESAIAFCDDVDIAVLDVDLQGVEVFPVADRLRAAGKPFIFHTGRADVKVLSRRYGPDVLIVTKPSRSSDLLQTLATVLKAG